MDYVQVPIRVAQKAMRFYRPLLPYVKKRIAELRNEGKIVETEIPVEEIKTKSKKAKK